MATEYRIDVYNAAGTTRAATFNPENVLAASITREENGSYVLSMKVNADPDVAATAAIARRSMIWVAKVGSADTPRKFRVLSITRKRDRRSGLIADIQAAHVGADLSRDVVRVPVRYAERTVGDLFAAILADSSQGFTAGTVDSTLDGIQVGDFEIAGTRMECLQKLRELCDAVLVVNDDKTVDLNLRLDLAGGFEAVVHPDKNLLDEGVQEEEVDLASRIYALGGGDPRMTLAGAWHPVVGVSTAGSNKVVSTNRLAWTDNTYTTQDSRTYYIELASQVETEGPGVAVHRILSFSTADGGACSMTVVPNGTYGWSTRTGDKFRIYVNDGVDLYLLDAVEDGDAYTNLGGWVDAVIDEGDLEPVENLFLGAFCDLQGGGSISAGLTDITTYGTATLSRNTDTTYIRNGVYSQRVQTAKYLQGVYADFDLGNLNESNSAYFSVKVLIYLAAGQVQIDVSAGDRANAADGNRGTIYPDPNRAIFSQVGWHEVVIEGIPIVSGGYEGRVWIYQAQGASNTADFYIDAIQVEAAASASDVWTQYGTRRTLWERTWREMRRRKDAKRSITISIRDRSEEDPVRNPYDIFDVSDRIKVISTEVGLDEVLWCTRYTRDLLKPGATTVELTSRTESLADQQGDLLADLEKMERRIGSVAGRQARDRTSPLSSRRILGRDPDGSRSMSYLAFEPQAGPGNNVFYFAGYAVHGFPFAQRIVVPSGRKAIVLFTPTRTFGLPSQISSDGWPYWAANEQELLRMNPALLPDLRNDVAFSLRDAEDNPIRFLKIFVAELGDYRTNPIDVSLDRTTAFDSWIPPGSYDDLMLFAWGESENHGVPVLYGGTLLLLDAPLFRGRLYADVSAGDSDFRVQVFPATSAAGLGGGHVLPHGKLRVGEGANAETVSVDRLYASGFDPSRRLLASGVFTYAHSKGEPVVEVQPGT